MNIEKLLIPDMASNPEYFSPVEIDSEACDRLYKAILKAYESADIYPLSPGRLCPGLTEGDYSFQANVMMTPQGVKMGSHYLVADTSKTHVNEVDIFAFNGVLESTSGRLRHPDEKYLKDYTATTQGVNLVTEFVLDRCKNGGFEAVEESRVLALPQ